MNKNNVISYMVLLNWEKDMKMMFNEMCGFYYYYYFMFTSIDLVFFEKRVQKFQLF